MISYQNYVELFPSQIRHLVSRETFLDHLKHYELLVSWQKLIQLVSRSTLSDYWIRHVLDSVQLQQLYFDNNYWIDIGSGGGFPSLPIAIQMKNNDNFRIHLVESNQKKCAFLTEVSRQCNLKTIIHCQRIESGLSNVQYGHIVITARALADISTLLDFCYIIGKSAQSYECAFLKSKNSIHELTDALKSWTFDYSIVDSVVDQRGCIVQIRNLKKIESQQLLCAL